MNQVKIIATFLKYLCYVLAFGYLLTVIYSAFGIISGSFVKTMKNGSNLHILFPFSDTTFLIAENNIKYILFSFLLPMLFYGIFFMLSSQVSTVFLKNKIFTLENQKIFERYYIYNTYLPLPLIFIASFFVETESIIWILLFIHLILGIFSLFLSTICKQGLHLQHDQDLII